MNLPAFLVLVQSYQTQHTLCARLRSEAQALSALKDHWWAHEVLARHPYAQFADEYKDKRYTAAHRAWHMKRWHELSNAERKLTSIEWEIRGALSHPPHRTPDMSIDQKRAAIRASMEAAFHTTARADVLRFLALVKARLLLGWCTGVLEARDAAGNPCKALSPEARFWTLAGACDACSGGDSNPVGRHVMLAARYLLGLVTAYGGWEHAHALNESCRNVKELISVIERAEAILLPPNAALAAADVAFHTAGEAPSVPEGSPGSWN